MADHQANIGGSKVCMGLGESKINIDTIYREIAVFAVEEYNKEALGIQAIQLKNVAFGSHASLLQDSDLTYYFEVLDVVVGTENRKTKYVAVVSEVEGKKKVERFQKYEY